ncbi:hypothetical protein Hanom_Chr10g00943511 [Helianthus anomalus]
MLASTAIYLYLLTKMIITIMTLMSNDISITMFFYSYLTLGFQTKENRGGEFFLIIMIND